MPTIGAFDDSFSPSGAFLTSRVTTPERQVSGSMLADEEKRELTQRIFNTKYHENRGTNIFERVAGYAAAAGVDLADTLVAAAPGIDKGDVWNLIGDYGPVAGAELKDFYERNQSGVELLSGVTGAVAIGYIGGSMILPRLANAMASSTAINQSALWQWGAAANAATRVRMLEAQGEAAAKGIAYSAWRNTAGRRYLANRVGRGASIAAFEEGLIVAGMHENQLIWSDDISNNLFWMGAGIGIGAAIGGIGARAEIRRQASSPEIIGLRQLASDPQGITYLREHQPEADVLAGMKIGKAKESAKTTILALEARQETPTGAAPELATRFQTTRAQAKEQMLESAQKITSKGIPGVRDSHFNLQGEARAQFEDAISSDPMVLHGLDSLGSAEKRTVGEVMDDFITHVDELMSVGQASEKREARRLLEQQPLVIVDGKLMPVDSNAKLLSHYVPGRADFKNSPNTAEFVFKSDSGKNYAIDESFSVRNASGQTRTKEGLSFAQLPMVDRMQLIEGFQRVFAKMKADDQPFNMPKDPKWEQIDAALAFERSGGKVIWTRNGLKSREEALLLSMKLKHQEIHEVGIGSVWDRLSYNLPLPTAIERIEDGAGDTMRAVLEAANQGASYEELQALYKQLMKSHGFALFDDAKEIDLSGNLFNFNRTESGKWKPMLVGMYDNESWLQPFNEYGVAANMAELKAERFQTLLSQEAHGGVVPTLAKQITALPDFIPSTNIRGLADDQVTGTGSFAKQLIGEFVTREMKHRDSAQMLAAGRVVEAKNRWVDSYLRELIERNFGDLTAKLGAAPNQGARALVNQFFSNAAGWDLKKQLVSQGDGKWAFALMKTENNAARLGRKVEDGDLLVNPRSGATIALDDLAREYVDAFQGIASHLLLDKNRIRQSMGLAPIVQRSWYVPPPSTKGKLVAFVMDEFNQPVPGGGIIASTKSEFDQMIGQRTKGLMNGQTIVTREQVRAASDLMEQAMMDWFHPGTLTAPGKGQSGALFSDTVNPKAIEDMLTWVREQTESIGTGTMRVLYDSQLGIARARAATERAVQGLKTKNALASRIEDRVRTVWDEYESLILGKQLGDMNRSISGFVMHPIEAVTNAAIQTVWPALKHVAPSQIGNHIGQTLQMLGVRKWKPVRTFDEMAKQLGPYTPYKSATDYAEQQMGVTRPPEIREISEKLNWLSSALLLRWGEIGHASMNLIGIVTTNPSILRSGRAPISTYIDVPNGKIPVVDSMKIMLAGMKDMIGGRRGLDWDYMVKNGDAEQQVAEFNRQLALVKDRGSFGRVMLGSGSKQGKKGLRGFVNEKGIDGLVSAATDVTENWGRQYAHFVGLRMADIQGIQGLEARHTFAREIANATIANYNPLNRPEAYQSAYGSMFGLFMSWMQSYNQRLFRWVEDAQGGRIAEQLAMQSSLFGISSNPGYDLIERAFLWSGTGRTESGDDSTITDQIYARFGPIVGTTLAHGGLQELGLVLYTRGDMNYRDVSLDPSSLMAGIGVMGNVASMIREAAETVFSKYSLSDSGRLSEVIARNMPNRVMKGVLVALNGGEDVDSRGQIISENISFFDTAVRMAGLRTQRQQAEIEAFYSNKQAQDREAARFDVVRNETRSLIRNDPDWESKVQSVFDKYVATGGSPAHFRTWIRDQIRAATNTRGVNQLKRALSNPKNHSEVWRYEMYGGG